MFCAVFGVCVIARGPFMFCAFLFARYADAVEGLTTEFSWSESPIAVTATVDLGSWGYRGGVSRVVAAIVVTVPRNQVYSFFSWT